MSQRFKDGIGWLLIAGLVVFTAWVSWPRGGHYAHPDDVVVGPFGW